ncbi:uncharacterized protein LOC125061097 isoform X2 [Pieris napi]|uniref:uncharacterized protein LOC125061097 isoform X2 n=1 Tax=Pieris napi TaxID=78633 RepID=UPI001FB99EAA|nr:uncharacterized protein LOC125061097 isoform X2 [Pieris napi]
MMKKKEEKTNLAPPCFKSYVGRSNTMPMNFDIKVEVENVDENAIEKQHEILSWREIVKKSTEIYMQSNNIGDKILHGQISIPKTIGDRLKSTPAKHDSQVDSQKNTFLLSHDTQDMVNDRDDDDDVIIIDNVPEVIVIPSDDAPNDDLPCVIANIKSELLEIELQTSKTKHTVTPQNDFECKTMVIQIPKDTKDVIKCLSDGNRINDDKVLGIEEIKREPELKGNSELNVSMESTFGILSTQSMTTNNVNTVNNIKMLRSQTKQTLLTNVSRNSESDVKVEVIKIEEEKLMRVDLSDIQLNEQKREEGRPAEISTNLEQITPKELEVSEPLKVEKNVETFVEIDIPWDAVPIKEEADPEMDFRLSDIRRIYHVDVVNVGENKIDVKQKINEFDSTGQSENWHQDNFAYNSQHSSDDEFENDFITISPNVTLNTDDDSDDENRTQRKKEILYSCIRCNFKGEHRLYKQHKRYECQKSIHLYDYHCSLCKNSFDSMHTYLLHFEKHGVPELICPQCGHGGITLKSLSLHVKMHIKSLFVSYRSFHSDGTITAPVLKCKVCYADVTRPDFIKHWDTHLDLNNVKRRLKSPEMLLPQLPHGFQTLDHDDTPDIKKALIVEDITKRNAQNCKKYYSQKKLLAQQLQSKSEVIHSASTSSLQMTFEPQLNTTVTKKRLSNAEKCKNYRKRKKEASLKIKKATLTSAERSRMYRLRKKRLTQLTQSSVNEVLYTPSTSNSRMTFEASTQPVTTD